MSVELAKELGYDGHDKLGFYHLINGRKYRPVDLSDNKMVLIDETLADKARRNREMVEHSLNQRPPARKFTDWGRTGLLGKIDRNVWKPLDDR